MLKNRLSLFVDNLHQHNALMALFEITHFNLFIRHFSTSRIPLQPPHPTHSKSSHPRSLPSRLTTSPYKYTRCNIFIMPVTSNTALRKDIGNMKFLCGVPAIDITPALEAEVCCICHEPYKNNGWVHGVGVHHPVKLPCRHIFGLQCLTLWMLSPSFDNRCCFCRAKIVEPSTIRLEVSRTLDSSFGLFEILAVTSSNGISRTQKAQLLEVFEKSTRYERARWTMTKDRNRVMTVFEQFLDKMCKENHQQINQQVDRGPARIAPIVRPQQADGRPPLRDVIGFTVSLIGVIAADVLISRLPALHWGPGDVLVRMNWKLHGLIFAILAYMLIRTFGLLRGHRRSLGDNIAQGVVCGVLFLCVRDSSALKKNWVRVCYEMR